MIQQQLVNFFLVLTVPILDLSFNYKCDFSAPCLVGTKPRGHSAHTHTGGGSVQEIFKQPKNITPASQQPKNISSFYIYKPVHEHKISPNNANRSQDPPANSCR